MSRHDEIQNAYQYLGKEATFYDGMITCSIPRRRPIWFFVFLFYTQDLINDKWYPLRYKDISILEETEHDCIVFELQKNKYRLRGLKYKMFIKRSG